LLLALLVSPAVLDQDPRATCGQSHVVVAIVAEDLDEPPPSYNT
jgi:hypothetical protein